tara:strand:- start:1101 stop:1541 length:441 start_codon:yes stop_codon:yes gene_type:complete
MGSDSLNTNEYFSRVKDSRYKIQSTQIRAVISLNREMLGLYWEIGKSISKKINEPQWGSSIMDKIAKDLKREFPDQKGFSRSNLFYMKKWFEFHSRENEDYKKVPQLVGIFPWGHHRAIIAKTGSYEEAPFYCGKTVDMNKESKPE